MPERFDDFAKALDAGNSTEIRRLAHSLKGASASVGALRFSAASFELEKAAPTASMQDAAVLIEELRQCTRDLDEILREYDWEREVRRVELPNSL